MTKHETTRTRRTGDETRKEGRGRHRHRKTRGQRPRRLRLVPSSSCRLLAAAAAPQPPQRKRRRRRRRPRRQQRQVLLLLLTRRPSRRRLRRRCPWLLRRRGRRRGRTRSSRRRLLLRAGGRAVASIFVFRLPIHPTTTPPLLLSLLLPQSLSCVSSPSRRPALRPPRALTCARPSFRSARTLTLRDACSTAGTG